MLNGKRILVLLPAFNEERGTREVMKRMPDYVDLVVVVDNNSTDKTAGVAKESGATVLSEPRQGKGYAFRCFMRFLRDSRGIYDYVVMFDPDNTYCPKEIRLMTAPLDDGCDVVIGSRISPKRKRGSMSPLNLFGNTLLTLAANILYLNFTAKDICCGYWAFEVEKLKKLRVRAGGFDLEADLFSQASKNRYRMKAVPVAYGVRLGREKLRVRDGFGILARLIYNRFF